MLTVDETGEEALRARREPFELHVHGHDADAFIVHAFSGAERTNEPWRFTIEVSARQGEDLASSALGYLATLELRTGPLPRRFTGVLASVRFLGIEPVDGRVRFRVRLVSQLWLLKHRKRSRVFQNLRVDDVVRAVLDEARIPSTWLLGREYPVREYCTQYAESDLEFIERLLAEAGIAMRHEAPFSGERVDRHVFDELIFGDDGRFMWPLLVTLPLDKHGPSLRWRDAEETAAPTSTDVTRFEPSQRIRANAAAYREFDPENPHAKLEAFTLLEGSPGGVLEHYAHEAQFAFRKWAFAREEPERILRRERKRAHTVVGQSRVPALSPGSSFRLDGHPSELVRGEYAITRVRHQGRRQRTDGEAPTYENHFECVPATVLDVPRPKTRTRMLATLTATVVGPAGEEIHCDAQGRIRVQFHWDREGLRNETSTCWLRTMQAWGGEAWGTFFLPRVGMEVVVAFEDGDPDKPLVLGSLYNGTHPVPFSLPDERAKSGIRTRSTPGSDGYNELSFDDARDRERILLRAQRDLAMSVGHDHTTSVEHDQSLDVAHNQTTKISNDRSLRVLGSRLDETHGRAVEKTLGDSEHHIGGERELQVGGSERRTIAGDAIATVQGRLNTRVKGDHAVSCGGTFSVEMGTRERPAGLDLYAWGTSHLGAGGELQLRADQRIVLTCGESSITLDATSIELRAPHVKLIASETVTAESKGPILKLDEHAELSASTVTITSRKASLALDDDAHLDGMRVLLACGGAEPSALTDEEGLPLTQPLRLRLLDARYEAHANKEFVVKAAGRRFEGTTGADGALDVEVPIEATSADVTVWLAKRPEGPTRRYAVELSPLDAPETILGVRQRLRHLGYDARLPTSELDAATKASLQHFQRDRGLDATGEPDQATLAELNERHGH